MATDPNKKTLRHFQCRDYLWETFEQMSAELECSVDYLINEAMRQYARSRSYGNRAPAGGASNPAIPVPTRESSVSDSAPPTVPPAAASPAPAVTAPPAPRTPAIPGMPPARAPQGVPGPRGNSIPPLPSTGGAAMPRIPSLPSIPGAKPPGGAPSRPGIPSIARPGVPALPSAPPAARPNPAQVPGRAPAPALPPAPAPTPAPTPAPSFEPPPVAAASSAGPTLYAVYNGERFPVTKEEFIIGRGQKTSDLVIRDSNVSRRHAVVVLHNGQYWMVDQQSTNGVEFMGAKIDRKRIDDGDVFKICDYEVLFTYR